MLRTTCDESLKGIYRVVCQLQTPLTAGAAPIAKAIGATREVEDADGVFFGKNGKMPGWIGNWLDEDGERDCDSWATHVRSTVDGASGWKVERVEDALKAGDVALGLLFMHNFVLLKFDPNNANPDPAFVLDPWIDARPKIWEYETFNKLWPIDSASRVY